MAKRLSSMFSLGSNYSDQSSDSRLGSSIHPARPPKEQSNAVLTQKTTTDLRPSSNLQDLHNGHSSGLTPPFNPTLLPRIEDSDPFLQAPRLLAPVYPPRLDSPGGSRPSSRENRPENSEDFFSPPPLLKPLPTLPDSANASRPVSRDSRPGSRAPSRPTSQPPSRPASPTKFRPLTPTSETTKVSKRRSWLPGKSRPESQDGSDGFQMPQAWLVTPREKLQYDPSSLASFVKVGSTCTRVDKQRIILTIIAGTRALERKWRHSSIPTYARMWQRSIFQGRLVYLRIFKKASTSSIWWKAGEPDAGR